MVGSDVPVRVRGVEERVFGVWARFWCCLSGLRRSSVEVQNFVYINVVQSLDPPL